MRKKVVLIGGGSGSFNVLKGLKKYALRSDEDDSIEISSIVTMMDSGGSSGVIRDEHGTLPPGDARRCLVALSNETELMKELFQYRFGENLKGHSFGNLFLTALTEILGSEDKAMIEAGKMLDAKGKVIPVTLDKVNLCAELMDGSILKKESEFDEGKKERAKIKRVFLNPKAKANPSALYAIKEADVIILGPGDLFASIISNLLVEGISEAINSSKAVKIYNCNIMTKHGETDGYSVKDFSDKINEFIKVDIITYSKTQFSPSVLKKYKAEKAEPVDKEIPKNAIGFDFATQPIVRHDSEKTAKVLIGLIFGDGGKKLN